MSEIVFHRLSFPQAFSEKCVPLRGSSIMAEITANEGDGIWELSDEQLIERAIADVEKIGFVDRDSIVYRRVTRAKGEAKFRVQEYLQTLTSQLPPT